MDLAASRSPSSIQGNEDRVKSIAEARMDISKKHLMDRLVELQEEVEKVSSVQDLEDYQVTEFLRKSSVWEEQQSQ